MATRQLAHKNLTVEFWVDAARFDGDDHGPYQYLATDQLRFVKGDNVAVALDSIPPRLLSEIMRDVDLFVSVASIGNDPGWQDGGPDRRFADYWERFAFGSLGATAETRREALAALLPALSIASRCSLGERFLVVRGDRRSYKIHLGSAHVQIEPDSQYLCIVSDRSKGATKRVVLPFEGDGTLSLILSKAFLLAEDGKITDPGILSQIERAGARQPHR